MPKYMGDIADMASIRKLVQESKVEDEVEIEDEDDYEEKYYKIISIDTDLYEDPLQELEDKVNAYMENTDDDYVPLRGITVIGSHIVQVLVDEDYT